MIPHLQFLAVMLLSMPLQGVECFVTSPLSILPSKHSRSPLTVGETKESQDPSPVEDSSKEAAAAKLSLEAKMANWEASEEEIKAATLGGLVPQQRTDSFDVGLYVAFPFMVIGCLLFLAFPFLVDNIDVSSVGPPPTS
jgi:hypothetical protein